MSLLTDLQAYVLDPGRNLRTALRRAKVLGFNLKNAELRLWVENELAGYKGSALVPDYRHLKIRNRGNFMNSAWRFTNQAIPLSVLLQDLLTGLDEHVVHQSIPVIEATLESGEGAYQVPWPPELANLLSSRVYDNLSCTSAWKDVQRTQLVNIIETVRDRLLSISLELMDQVPDLKNDTWENHSEDAVHMIIHNNIYGNRNVVATGEEVSQTVSLAVDAGDLESLAAALLELGLSPEDTKEFQDAVDRDGSREHQEGLGPRVNEMIGKLVGRSMNVASTASAALVAQAIASYYGWR